MGIFAKGRKIKIIKIFYLAQLGIGILLVSSSLMLESIFGSRDEREVRLAPGYTISAYEVVLDVKEDYRVFVTENITVNFLKERRYGIYRSIPEKLNYTGKNNKVIKRKSNILNLQAIGESYTLSNQYSRADININEPYEYEKARRKNIYNTIHI